MYIEEIEKNIEFLTKILAILKEDSNSYEEIILKKYIELESLPKLKLFIQDLGIRTERGTIYQTNDLSEIIRKQPSHVNQDILNLAYKIYNNNSKIVNKLYN